MPWLNAYCAAATVSTSLPAAQQTINGSVSTHSPSVNNEPLQSLAARSMRSPANLEYPSMTT
jgi:hypothetical protein